MAKTPKDPAASRRRSMLAAIHAQAKQLEGLDEDAYRALVERVSGLHGPAVRSAGDCTPRQLDAVLDELKRLSGATVRGVQPGQPWPGRPAGELTPLLSKIEALLADGGLQWSYATSIAKRMFKIERLEWCSDEQLGKVVAALQINAIRHGRGRRRAGGRRPA